MKLAIQIILCFTLNLFSFSAKCDTVDNFQFKIRNKLILNESGVGSSLSKINLLILKQSDRNQVLTITYFHCTRGVENRKIYLKDSTGKVIYTWSFHPESARPEMGIPINEIIELIKSRSFFSLYYSDSLIKEETFLTLLEIDNRNYINALIYYKAKYN